MTTLVFLDIESVSSPKEYRFCSKPPFIKEASTQLAGAVPHEFFFEKRTLGADLSSCMLLHCDCGTRELSAQGYGYARKVRLFARKDALPMQEVMKRFVEFLPATGDVVFVAHNGNGFDFQLLKICLLRSGIELPKGPNYKTFDSYVYMRTIHPDKDLKLSSIYQRVTGKELVNAHTAEADTKALIEVLEASFGGPQKLFPCILERAVKWDERTDSSVYGLGVVNGSTYMSISRESSKKLEDNGLYTRAAVVRAWMHESLGDLSYLSPEDRLIVVRYCGAKTKSLQRKQKAFTDVPPIRA